MIIISLFVISTVIPSSSSPKITYARKDVSIDYYKSITERNTTMIATTTDKKKYTGEGINSNKRTFFFFLIIYKQPSRVRGRGHT